jgi:putative addiction module antidote
MGHSRREIELKVVDSLEYHLIINIIILCGLEIAMVKLKVRAIGTSAGVILPKEALAHMGVREGDELFLVESPDGYQVTPYDPTFEKQLESARKGMDAFRNTLRELAK